MDKEQLKEMIAGLRHMQEQVAQAYLENTLTLTEVGAPQEAFEMLEQEHLMLANKTTQAIKNAEFMLATA